MKQRVYEPTNEPPARFVHTDTFADAFEGWTRFMYPRHRFVIVWGFFFWLWLPWQAFKAVVFFTVTLLLFLAWMGACVWDAATYPRRLQTAGWGKALS